MEDIKELEMKAEQFQHCPTVDKLQPKISSSYDESANI